MMPCSDENDWLSIINYIFFSFTKVAIKGFENEKKKKIRIVKGSYFAVLECEMVNDFVLRLFLDLVL